MFNRRPAWLNRLNNGNGDAPKPDSVVYGDQGVRFNDDGRPFFPGQDRPSNGNLLFWRRDRELAAGRDPDPAPVVSAAGPVDTYRYRPFSRTVIPAQRAEHVGAAPFITRRFDSPQSFQTTTRTTTMRPQITVVEEMKIYDEKPCAWWLFIVIGILMLILGILNTIWCWELHYYSRFWAGIMLLVFGICGALHRGDYIDVKMRSLIYILLGFITTAAVLAACAFVLQTLNHQVIEISQYGYPQYLAVQEFRYEYLKRSPLNNLTNWDYNIAVCLGLDSFQLLLCLLGFIVLTSTIYIIDRFFNSHYVIRRKVEPFCEPWLFNPWGQSSLGQVQILVGLTLMYSVHGTYALAYQDYGASIWAGILPVFAGISAALCLKSCDPDRRALNFLAIILEIVSIICSIIAIVINSFGLADNITTLRQTTFNVMNLTEWPVKMMVASSVIFAISDLICIINVFYSLSLLFRIFFCVCVRDRQTDEEYRFIEERSEDRFKSYEDRQYDEYPRRGEIGRFDPFRPAATRSFYVR